MFLIVVRMLKIYVTVLQVWIWDYDETGSRLQTALFFFEISALPSFRAAIFDPLLRLFGFA